MSAYLIAQIKINDPDEYKTYVAGFLRIFEKYDGELLVSSNSETTVIEGEWALPRTVVMKFPSPEHVDRWLNDPDYQALAAIRHRSAQTNLVLIDGVD